LEVEKNMYELLKRRGASGAFFNFKDGASGTFFNFIDVVFVAVVVIVVDVVIVKNRFLSFSFRLSAVFCQDSGSNQLSVELSRRQSVRLKYQNH
jgi:hypothetical protein